MENKNVIYNSILIMGGKAVGKSEISKAMQELTKNKIKALNLDFVCALIKSYAMCAAVDKSMFNSSYYNKFVSKTKMREYVMPYVERMSVEDFNGLLMRVCEKTNINEKETNEINETFKLETLTDFSKYLNIVKNIYSEEDEILDEYIQVYRMEYLYLVQILELEVLDRCLNKLTEPTILDTGFLVGAKFNLPKERVEHVDNFFEKIKYIKSGVKASELQNHVFNKIGKRVYIKGGSDYLTGINYGSQDEDNLDVLSNAESYDKFATRTVVAENLFPKNDERIKSRNYYDVISEAIFNKEKNIEGIKVLASELIDYMVKPNIKVR